MRILHVISSVSRVQGGPSRAIAEIERALTRRGIEVTTITTNDDGDGVLPVQCGRPVTTPFATRWYFPRTTVAYKVSTGLGWWLRENVKAFDVVHAHALFSFPPVAAAFIARRAGIPYVLRPLGVLAKYGMTRRRPLLKKASLALIERRLIEAASAVHFTSIAEQEQAEALGLKFKAAVISLGIDLDSMAGVDRSKGVEAGNLLFLSRIDRKKNLESLLHAMQRLSSSHPTLTLNIAGDGDPRYVLSLQALARRLAIDGRINWLGYVEGEGKRRVLRAASAFVLPSYSESFGIAVVEALAAGVPCVVSREVAISKEMEAAGAGIITDTTPEAIAAGLDQLLGDATGTAARSLAARKLAAHKFSLDAMGERLETLYRGMLSLEGG